MYSFIAFHIAVKDQINRDNQIDLNFSREFNNSFDFLNRFRLGDIGRTQTQNMFTHVAHAGLLESVFERSKIAFHPEIDQ